MIQGKVESDEQPSHDPDQNEYEDEEDDQTQPEVQAPYTPRRNVPARPLGKFMTPQVSRTSNPGAHPRASLGATGAVGPRRVRLVEPWRVTDLVVPMDKIKDEEDEQADTGGHGTSPEKVRNGASEKKKLSEEERRVSAFLFLLQYMLIGRLVMNKNFDNASCVIGHP